MTVTQMEKSQPLNAEDLAYVVRMFREMRQWSQDTLAAISKLSIRTIQRVENGEASNGDTRRALALAFEIEDIDIFNKPFAMPDPAQIQAEVDRIKREHLTLSAQVVKTGRELVLLFEQAQMDSPSQRVEMEGTAAEAFAGLMDYLRDHRECADLMSETDKVRAYRDVQGYLDDLDRAGFTVSYARRDTQLVGKNWTEKTPMDWTIVYLVVAPKGEEPKLVLVPKKINF